jgi:tRNA threonylcarbamoyladenosine biosynthesis protein TsaB
MIVLGLDTSTHSSAAALRLADGLTIEERDDPPAGAHPGHATRLLEMTRAVLARADVGWDAIERIAVGVGPGAFTGLRVGVATARGLAQSLSVEIVGVSSTLALAAAMLATDPRGDEAGAVLAVIDARRGEAFAAAYERGDGEDGAERRAPLELASPRAIPPEQIWSVIAEAEAAAAVSASWRAVGDGAVRFRAQLESAGAHVPPDSSPLHLVSAAAICALGSHAAAMRLSDTVPDYRRRPDAELALAARGSAKSVPI